MGKELETSTPPARAPAEKASASEARPARELDRLPPPAFPPGTRRARASRSARSAPVDNPDGDGFPEGALISPDEPVRRIGDGLPQGALISPDDPITPASRDGGEDAYEVEVTGIGESQGGYYASGGEVRDAGRVAAVLEEIARRLREDGPGGLLATRATSRLESTVRGVVAGYLLEEED